MMETYEKKVEMTQDDSLALSFPAVLTLLEDDGSSPANERLAVYASIPLW